MKKANESHALLDPVSGEGSIVFTPLGDGTVEVAETCHPDIPEDVTTMELEAARALYRLCRSRGMVAA